MLLLSSTANFDLYIPNSEGAIYDPGPGALIVKNNFY